MAVGPLDTARRRLRADHAALAAIGEHVAPAATVAVVTAAMCVMIYKVSYVFRKRLEQTPKIFFQRTAFGFLSLESLLVFIRSVQFLSQPSSEV